MFLELRSKLALFDSYVNPFHPRGALRLARYHPRSYLALTFLAAAGGYLFLFLLVDKRSCEKVRARLISSVARSAF